MELIEKQAMLDNIKDPVVKGYVMFALRDAPTVDAVPLDKLCEWLERNAAGRWNGLEYTASGWKDELAKWMEEQK